MRCRNKFSMTTQSCVITRKPSSGFEAICYLLLKIASETLPMKGNYFNCHPDALEG